MLNKEEIEKTEAEIKEDIGRIIQYEMEALIYGLRPINIDNGYGLEFCTHGGRTVEEAKELFHNYTEGKTFETMVFVRKRSEEGIRGQRQQIDKVIRGIIKMEEKEDRRGNLFL